MAAFDSTGRAAPWDPAGPDPPRTYTPIPIPRHVADWPTDSASIRNRCVRIDSLLLQPPLDLQGASHATFDDFLRDVAFFLSEQRVAHHAHTGARNAIRSRFTTDLPLAFELYVINQVLIIFRRPLQFGGPYTTMAQLCADVALWQQENYTIWRGGVVSGPPSGPATRSRAALPATRLAVQARSQYGQMVLDRITGPLSDNYIEIGWEYGDARFDDADQIPLIFIDCGCGIVLAAAEAWYIGNYPTG